MINFRFHLVSLIAVFLALAVGIVVGSTVIDRAIVDGLEAQIDRVERNSEAQREENDLLRRQIGDIQALADQSAPFAIHERLLDVPIVALATRGSDEDAVHALVDAAREAGAVVPAVVWIEPAWTLDDRAQRDGLREFLGVPRGDAEVLRAAAFEQLAARIAAGELVPAAPTEEAPAPPPDVLAGLVDQGFLSVDRAGGPELDLATFPGAGARVMVMASAGAAPNAVVFPGVVRSLADAALLTLGVGISEPGQEGDAETGGDGEAVADLVRLVRDDDLGGRVSTVDSALGIGGQVAVVLALEELGRGEHGHYGSEPGAQRRLPAPADA